MSHWIERINQQIQAKHLLKHEFYQAWSRGELSKECLKDYAAQYYHHVKAFPTYLSALHSHTEEEETREAVLQNLIEEGGHPKMWLDFAIRLGQSQQQVECQNPISPIESLISLFKEICLKEDIASGIAVLYAYESQIPSICESKIDGLQRFYGMKTPEEWKYFTVHIEADKEHSEVEKRLLEKTLHVGNIDRVQANVQKVLDALWNFLTVMCQRHGISCAALGSV